MTGDDGRRIRLRHRAEMGLLKAFAGLLGRLPLRAARNLAGAVGSLAARLGIRRKVALDNIARALPEVTPPNRLRIYRQCFRHFLMVGAEMAHLPGLNLTIARRWMDIESYDALKRILARGRGIIIASGHIGNWEWLGGVASLLGLPVSYVVTTQANPLVEMWMDRMRRSTGVEIIPRRDAVKGVVRALRRNRIVAILCDQDAGRTGVFTTYFGRPASTPRGVALFHLKYGAPIVFAAAVRAPDGRFDVIFDELTFPNLTGERSRDETAIMQAVTARLEREVRRAPQQWLWLHRRWKTRPDEALV